MFLQFWRVYNELMDLHEDIQAQPLEQYSVKMQRQWEWLFTADRLVAAKPIIEIILHYTAYINRGRPDCKIDNYDPYKKDSHGLLNGSN